MLPSASFRPGRRQVLGLAALGVAGPVLAGCTPDGATNPPPSSSEVVLPTYTAVDVAAPDLPGSEDGVLPGYLSYPADPQRMVPEVAALGGEVTAVTQVSADQLERPDNNGRWRAINERLGTSLRVSGAAGADFDAKVQTLIAGDDLPDLLQVTSMPRLPAVLRAKFADLSEYLAGDAVQDYPMLAALPTQAWRTCIHNGGIYGIPATRGGAPSNLLIRRDLFEEAGVDPAVTSAEDLLVAARALTDPRQSRWAFGTDPAAFLVPMVQQMLGVPNEWAEADGAFASAVEHPETKRAIEYVATLWRDGLIHPDSIASPTQNSTWFRGRTTAMNWAGLSSWLVYNRSVTAEGLPASVIDAIVLPAFDGGGVASYWRGRASYSITALKQADPVRIRGLLSILNWMSAPFGSEEYRLKTYGVEDRNFVLEGTEPIAVAGKEEFMNFLNYIATAPEVLYQPGLPGVIRRQHDVQSALMPSALALTAEGLYSETQTVKGTTIAEQLTFAQNDIIAGRKPLSSWDDAVAEWRSNGGDQIRTEFQDAFAATQ